MSDLRTLAPTIGGVPYLKEPVQCSFLLLFCNSIHRDQIYPKCKLMKPFRWPFIFFNFSGASATIDRSPLSKPFSNLNPFSYFSSDGCSLSVGQASNPVL